MAVPLFDPDGFFEEHDDVPFLVSFAIVTAAGIVGALMIYLNFPIIEEGIVRELVKSGLSVEKARMLAEFVKTYLIVAPLIGSYIAWILLGGLIQVFSALLGGEGEFSKTLKFVAFGFLPSLVLAPVSYVVVSMTHDLTSLPVKLVGIASTIWQFYILTFAVKHARNLSVKNSAICVLLAIVVSMLLRFAGNLFRPS